MRVVQAVLLAVLFFGAPQARAESGDDGKCFNALKSIRKAYGSSQAKTEFEGADCSDHGVYCVGVDGYPLANEECDPDLRPGVPLKVKLLGPAECASVLVVGTDTKQTTATLFPKPEMKATPESLAKVAPVQEVKLLASTTVTPDASSVWVVISVARSTGTGRVEGIKLQVAQPRYYLDVGVLVAFTPEFQQVSSARVPGSQDAFIRETNTVRPAGAIGVNYFPFGQYSQARFTGYHGLGLQAAIGANFGRIDDEFYLGAIWEPIPGAGISTGLALLEMQRLQPDYPSGALVQPNDIPRDTYLGPRWYFGVTFNTQVFKTLLDVGGKVSVPN